MAGRRDWAGENQAAERGAAGRAAGAAAEAWEAAAGREELMGFAYTEAGWDYYEEVCLDALISS